MPDLNFTCHKLFTIHYSVRKDLTGFATAVFIAWKLTVINAIPNEASAVIANITNLY
jgi:hypothetical protein